MKQIIITLVAFFALTLFISNVNAQCRQQMVYSCATKTESIYLRDFNTKLKKTKAGAESGTKWTVVLNKDAHYRFNLCTPSADEGTVVLTLYDSQNPEFSKPYGSTYDKNTKKDYSSFDFHCRKSGMYYVSIRFKEGQGTRKTCAVGILSFVGSSN